MITTRFAFSLAMFGLGASMPWIECECETLEGAGASTAGGQYTWAPLAANPGTCDSACDPLTGCRWIGTLSWTRPAGSEDLPWMSTQTLDPDADTSDYVQFSGLSTGLVQTNLDWTVECEGAPKLVQAWAGSMLGRDDFWFECGACLEVQ